jgi:A/G-specific adenine glycosylase
VDGNVERVLQRLTGKAVKGEEVWQMAESRLDQERPGDFNQAMMELGATICLPRQPRCLLCPVSNLCATRGELQSTEGGSPQRKRTIHFGLAHQNGQVFLVQRRSDESLMPGMWELPELPSAESGANALLSLRHSITVTDYAVQVFAIAKTANDVGRWVPTSRLTSLPLTGLARKILLRAQILGAAKS